MGLGVSIGIVVLPVIGVTWGDGEPSEGAIQISSSVGEECRNQLFVLSLGMVACGVQGAVQFHLIGGGHLVVQRTSQ